MLAWNVCHGETDHLLDTHATCIDGRPIEPRPRRMSTGYASRSSFFYFLFFPPRPFSSLLLLVFIPLRYATRARNKAARPVVQPKVNDTRARVKCECLSETIARNVRASLLGIIFRQVFALIRIPAIASNRGLQGERCIRVCRRIIYESPSLIISPLTR